MGSTWYPKDVTINIELWNGERQNFQTNSRGFTDNEAQLIVDIYFKHCEHVCHEGRLDFARQLLNLVEEGKIAVTPTKG